MEFKDYYATLGVPKDATQDAVKRAYRQLARKYHPDVSQETDAEVRFKEVAEAYEVLKDPQRRAAYDSAGERWRNRAAGGEPPPDWNTGYEFRGDGSGFEGMSQQEFSDFFESLFGRQMHAQRQQRRAHGMHGEDHHAKVMIDLEDAYRGATRGLTLRMPVMDEHGNVTMREHQIEVRIPQGIRPGQQLRLAGQGGPGLGSAPAGDLYLEVEFAPHPLYTVDGKDVSLQLPVAPWEAVLGAEVTVPTPDGHVQMNIPAGSTQGRKLRLRGKGLPGKPPGDFYVVLTIALPQANGSDIEQAWRALARSAGGFDPRAGLAAAATSGRRT